MQRPPQATRMFREVDTQSSGIAFAELSLQILKPPSTGILIPQKPLEIQDMLPTLRL